MLYNQRNLDVCKIASKGNGLKPVLESVMFSKNFTVATDSYRLLEISTPKNAKVGDFPKVQGVSAMIGFSPFLVNAKMLKDKVKIPKKTNLPILQNVAVKHIHDNRVEFYTTEGTNADIQNVVRVQDTFPDYEKIFPSGKPLAEVELNGELLAELLEVMSKLDNLQRVKIKIYGALKPVVLEAGDDNQKGRGMVMPMNR